MEKKITKKKIRGNKLADGTPKRMDDIMIVFS